MEKQEPPTPFPFAGGKKMMCERPEAAASRRCPGPAGPAPMLLGHIAAGAEDRLLCHTPQKPLWEMTPSPSVLTAPLGCSQTHVAEHSAQI